MPAWYDGRMKRHLICFLLALGFAVGFLALADEAREQELFTVDHTVQAFARAERQPGLEAVMRAVSRLGSGPVLVPLALTVATVLWWRGERGLSLLVPSVSAGGVLLEGLTKWIVHRPRPHGTGYGFPSGHVIGAVVVFGALVYLVWIVKPRPAWRGVALGMGVLAVVGVAWSRIQLDAHWLSDVAGGLTGALAYVLGVLGWVERSRSRGTARPTRGKRRPLPQAS